MGIICLLWPPMVLFWNILFDFSMTELRRVKCCLDTGQCKAESYLCLSSKLLNFSILSVTQINSVCALSQLTHTCIIMCTSVLFHSISVE